MPRSAAWNARSGSASAAATSECCESWRGHASAHAEETGHPVIAAWRCGAFAYCYPHRRYL